MKLIFKIYKKVRELKKKENKFKKKENELSDSITSLVIEKTMLESDIEKLQYERLHENDAINCRDARQNERDARQNERQTQLDEREKELNNLQEKLNDQILKLGIVKGVNK